MSDGTESGGEKVRLRDRLWAQIAGAILLVLAVFFAAFYGFALIDTHPARAWPWSAKTHPGLFELSRTAVPVAALVGGAAAIVVGIRRQRSTEKTVELTARTAQITADAYALDQKRAGREEIDRLRDRYTAIAAQLGDDAAPVRLAGVYAMAALADDWITMGNHREAQVCIDVLCAYIRTPRHTTTSEDAVADTRVRETITRVIAQHLQAGAATTSWSDKAFDFTEARFTGSHSFTGAEFNEGCQVDFGAKFNNGHVDFSGAEFNNGHVDFSRAEFNEEWPIGPWGGGLPPPSGWPPSSD